MTETQLTFRAPYDKYPQIVERHWVFAGTTNDETPLNDTTGARRTWLLEQATVPTQNPRLYIITHRDQLWAEAKAAHEAGEDLY